MDLLKAYKKVRKYTASICMRLQNEDYVPQPTEEVSPPKWHLAHTTWFFETFILIPFYKNYKPFHPKYNYLFNSYYEAEGRRVLRSNRGALSRPTVKEVYEYRAHVDEFMINFLHINPLTPSIKDKIILGLNHEEQHQELLITDIKYILGNNPLYPKYSETAFCETSPLPSPKWITINEGLYSVGHKGKGFGYDNELGNHQVYLNKFAIRVTLVSNKEYMAFIEDGGYEDYTLWHADAWQHIQENKIRVPLYWQKCNNKWHYYTFNGIKQVDPDSPVCHVSYYEAFAFAQWKNMRLPTEFEWEVAAENIQWGSRWEWTESAYQPYPGYKKAEGSIGEYNGKFMVNQKVLRGASVATTENHSRKTYRNFFHPQLRWQFTGIRLVKN